MELYDLSLSSRYLDTIYSKSHRDKESGPSLSRLFKHIRKNKIFAVFGDYPILSFIICDRHDRKVSTTRRQIIGAFKYSPEYKEIRRRDKMLWYKMLLEQSLSGEGNENLRVEAKSKSKKAVSGKKVGRCHHD